MKNESRLFKAGAFWGKILFSVGPALTTRAAYLKAACWVLLVRAPIMMATAYLCFASGDGSSMDPLLWLFVFATVVYNFSYTIIIWRRFGLSGSTAFLAGAVTNFLVVRPYLNWFDDEPFLDPLHYLAQAAVLLAFALVPNPKPKNAPVRNEE